MICQYFDDSGLQTQSSKKSEPKSKKDERVFVGNINFRVLIQTTFLYNFPITPDSE